MNDTATAAHKPQTLDDVMIAMDVVDTIRHREGLVARELNEAGREADLIRRLKEIYRQQGIEVPDHVLAEGVKALKESRFTYTPAPPGWKRTLATMWVRRGRYGAIAGLVLAALLTTCSVNYFNVTRPAHISNTVRLNDGGCGLYVNRLSFSAFTPSDSTVSETSMPCCR